MSNTSLTPNEILSFQEACFCLPKHSLPPRDLFRFLPSSIEADDQHQELSLGAGQAPSKCDGKFVPQN